MQKIRGNIITLALVASTSPLALASQQDDAKGFIDGSSFNILSRNVFFHRDFRDGGGNKPYDSNGDGKNDAYRNGYNEEWAQGFLGVFQSGFTQGTLGFGVDGIGKLGIRLDTGNGRSGSGLLDVDDSGHADSSYSVLGGAAKVRLSNTVLRYGDQQVKLPIFNTSDSRLLPEVARGYLLTSQEIPDLTLNAGHFTSLNYKGDSSHDSARLTSINFAGGTYNFSTALLGSLYYAKTDDYFHKTYGKLLYIRPLSSSQSLKFDFNTYAIKSEGEARAGVMDNISWSLGTSYAIGAHTFTVVHQRTSGTGNAYHGVDGGDTWVMGNAVQYSDFNYDDEHSWQARYDIDLAPYGVPGLSFMTRYVRGDNITTATSSGGTQWERDIEGRYVVQSGTAKNLSVRVRQATARSAVVGYQLDEVRVIVEYPLNVF